MKSTLFLIPVVFLAACGDAQQKCIKDAQKDLLIVQGLIAETEATIARGYAVKTETRTVVYTDFCVGSRQNNTGVTFCNRTAPSTTRTPIAVDLNAEQRKLESLRAKEAELIRSSAQQVQRCELEYPDS